MIVFIIQADSRVEQINKKLQQAVTDLEKQSRYLGFNKLLIHFI